MYIFSYFRRKKNNIEMTTIYDIDLFSVEPVINVMIAKEENDEKSSLNGICFYIDSPLCFKQAYSRCWDHYNCPQDLTLLLYDSSIEIILSGITMRLTLQPNSHLRPFYVLFMNRFHTLVCQRPIKPDFHAAPKLAER